MKENLYWNKIDEYTFEREYFENTSEEFEFSDIYGNIVVVKIDVNNILEKPQLLSYSLTTQNENLNSFDFNENTFALNKGDSITFYIEISQFKKIKNVFPEYIKLINEISDENLSPLANIRLDKNNDKLIVDIQSIEKSCNMSILFKNSIIIDIINYLESIEDIDNLDEQKTKEILENINEIVSKKQNLLKVIEDEDVTLDFKFEIID